jgi:hypothetical protein
MNQNGHGDYQFLLWIFIVALITIAAIEGLFITLAIIFWEHLFLRTVFSMLALGWIVFIVLNYWDNF